MSKILQDFILYEDVLFDRMCYIRDVLNNYGCYRNTPNRIELYKELSELSWRYSEIISKKEC